MISVAEIAAARGRIRGVANYTPVIACRDLLLKAESFQPIGSFKIRGAYNMTAQIADDTRVRGIITYSSGNHAQGVAYSARAFGIKAVIVMPDNAPAVKVAATRSLGAEIVTVSVSSEERREVAMELAREHGYTVVPPFDHPHILQGQATCGAEILEQVTDVDLILAPVGGGGLLGGVATAAKLLGKNVRVIGVEPALAGDAAETFRAGSIVGWGADMVSRTIADGLRTQAIGKNSFEHIEAYVDDILTVTEEEIFAAMRILALEGRMVVEPSGAVAAAAWFFHRDKLGPAQRPVAIVSGGNVEPAVFQAAMQAAPHRD
jgi:threonine dehydratase